MSQEEPYDDVETLSASFDEDDGGDDDGDSLSDVREILHWNRM